MAQPYVARRSPEIVILLAFVTCGLYLIYWYSQMYEEVERVSGDRITSTGYGLDLLFVILTCGIYGVYVDYRIAILLNDTARKVGLPSSDDPATIIIILDVASYLSGGFTNWVASAIQQGQLNKILEKMSQSSSSALAV